MGRTFPNGDNNTATPTYIHHLISTSLIFIACIAATFAIISSLCGFSRKKTKSSPDNQPPPPPLDTKSTTASPPPQPPQSGGATSDDITQLQNSDLDLTQQPLPPPPGRRHLSGAASCHFRSESASAAATASLHDLGSSRSMRIMGTGLSSRQGSKREDKHHHHHHHTEKKKDKNLKHEDSIWKKTIILGDKCRVPDDDDDDAIVYDEKGNRISTYHQRKNTNSMALSRQGSAIDQDAIPSNLIQGQNDD